MIDADVGVVLPAAGCGERMNTAIPKQYLKVLDKPLFLYALEEFLSLKCVRKISLVADNVERMSGILRMYHLDESDRISVVRGSRTRHRSIKIGLHDLINSGVAVTVVIVHDAVRPFVPRDLIDELIKEALRIGAAGPVRPLVSTILKTSSDYFLEESLNRSTYRCSETPQAFQLDILLSAYNKATEEDLDFGTECLQLVLNYCDIKAKLIPTDESLWKVTYSRDLHIVEAVVREKTSDVCIISEEENEAVNFLVDNLTSKVATIKAILGGASTQTKDNGKTYNTVIILHTNEIHEDLNLLDFATLIDLDKEGLIIHIIDHSSFDSLQTMSVYNLHRNSRKMAHHYNKLHKGVVVIHCVSSNETEKLASVVSTLIQADPRTFSEVELLMLPSSAKNMKANRSVELEGGECPSAFSPASPQKETLNCSSVLMSTPNICTGEEPTPTLENVYRRKRSHQFQKTTGLEPRNVIIVKQTNFKWLQTYIFILTRYCLCMQVW